MKGRWQASTWVLVLGAVLVGIVCLQDQRGVHGQPDPFRTAQGVRLEPPESPEPPLAPDLQLPPRPQPQRQPPNTVVPTVPGVEPVDPPPPEVTLKVRVAATAAKDRDLVYRLLVENRSSDARAHHVIVRDALPANVRYISATPAPSLEPSKDKVEDKPEVRWELGTLAPHERKELTLTLRPTGGDVRNTARIQFEFGQTVLTRLGQSDLGVRLTGPTRLAVMDKKDFQVEVTNTGSAVASDVVLKATLPTGLAFSLSEPAETADKALTWNLGDLAPGATRRVRLELLAQQEGDFPLRVEINDGGGTQKTSSLNVLVGQARLVLHLKGPANRFLASPVTYQITVNNIGTLPATGVMLDYQIPPECQFLSATTSGTATGDHVRWPIGTLAVGERRHVDLTLRLKNATEAVNLHSFAEVISDRGLKVQSPPVITRFEGGTGLAFEVEQSAHHLEVEGEGHYTVKVRNQGSAEATEVALVVRFPAELKVLSTNGPTAGKEDGGVVTFAPLPKLDPGKEARFEVTARALRVGEVRVRVEMKANQTAPVTGEESTRIFSEPMPMAK
jgi:uncharacterized repeat protein (TIGR01451 family)